MAFIPHSLLNKVVEAASEYVPIVGPAVKYSRKAVMVTKIAKPVQASTRAVGYLVSACSGPIIKLSNIHCYVLYGRQQGY